MRCSHIPVEDVLQILLPRAPGLRIEFLLVHPRGALLQAHLTQHLGILRLVPAGIPCRHMQMRGVRPEVFALAARTRTANPLIRRYGATLSQGRRKFANCEVISHLAVVEIVQIFLARTLNQLANLAPPIRPTTSVRAVPAG
jgi:hypothetical protein